MRHQHWILFAAFVGLVIAACSGGSNTEGTGGADGRPRSTCDDLGDAAPDDCFKPCTSNSDCTASFCESGQCQANCVGDEDCRDNEACNSRGSCVHVASTGGVGGSGGFGECQSVKVTPARSIPSVMFLVDQSESMVADFGDGEDRWQAAHSAINEIVSDPNLHGIVRFGLTTYTSRNGRQSGRTCPLLPTQIGFNLADSTPFSGTYPYDYPYGAGEDTPTGDSIDALADLILADGLSPDGPTIIVLATDGLPDSCECADGYPNPIDNDREYCEAGATDPKVEAVQAAAAAHAAEIDVFALWVGNLSSNPANTTRVHMQAVADAGVEGTGTVWVGDNPTSLSVAFDTIISDSISCDIQMDRRFDNKEQACNDPESDVQLGGVPIPCSDTNGWRVKPGVDDVIELVGSACDTFKSGDVTFSAEFPCGAIIVE